MAIKFLASSVALEAASDKVQVSAEMNTAQIKKLIVDLLCAMPEHQAAELIAIEFPDWLEKQ